MKNWLGQYAPNEQWSHNSENGLRKEFPFTENCVWLIYFIYENNMNVLMLRK